MRFSSLDKWYEYSLKKSKELADKYGERSIAYVRYLDVLRIKQYNLLDTLTNDFKSKLLEIIDTYELYNFDDFDLKHYHLVSLAFHFNIVLRKQYEVYSIRYFGNDVEKFTRKMSAIKKKSYKLKEKTVISALSPKDNLCFFKMRCEEVLVDGTDYDNEKRMQRRIKNDLIDDLIEAIVIDNYKNNTGFRGKIRITAKVVKMYEEEQNKILRNNGLEPIKYFKKGNIVEVHKIVERHPITNKEKIHITKFYINAKH